MMSSQLDYMFSKYYEKAVVKNSDASNEVSATKKRLDANQNLMAEAKALLATLSDAITNKCFVSKKKKEFLKQVLEGV